MKKSGLLILLLGYSSLLFAQNVKKIKIEDLVGYISKSDHPLVVNFWATWCATCLHELPYFQSNIKKYAEQKVELVLVSLDFKKDYPKRIADYIKEHKYEGSFFWLNETDADHFCPRIDDRWDGAIPASLFLNNKTGYRSFLARQLTEPQLQLELRSLIK